MMQVHLFSGQTLLCKSLIVINKTIKQHLVSFSGQVQRVDQRQIVAKDNIVTILISVVVAIVVVVGGICAICCFRSKIKNWLYHKSSEIYESRSASSSIGSGKFLLPAVCLHRV